MVKLIWFNLIFIGIVFSILTGNNITETIIKVPNEALSICLQIFPNIALWLGIMKIAEESNLLKKISKLLSPIMKKIFPEIPENHESISLITTNVVANLFGLGNASTPIGLKTMKSLQELNKNKKEASHSMITFLVLNTTGLTIIPTTILSLNMNAKNPTEIILPCFLASLSATIGGLIIDRILQRKDKKCKTYQT